MNRRFRLAAPLLALAAISALARAQSPAPPATDAKGPTAAVGAFVLAFNGHDATALGKLWTDAALHVADDSGERLEGRGKIVEAYGKLFAADPKCALTLQLGAPLLVAPTVASVDGVAELKHTDGSPTRSAVSAILVQQNGQWLLAQVHERDLPALPEAAPQLAALDWLAGEWTGGSENAGGGDQVSLNLHWAPNLSYMMGGLEHRHGGETTHEVFNVIGWDAEQQALRSWQFASDGGFAEGVWQADGENKWLNKLVAKFADGRRGGLTHVLTRTSPDQLTLQTIDREIDGEAQPNVAPITLIRQGAATTKPASAPAAAKAAPAAKKPQGAAR